MIVEIDRPAWQICDAHARRVVEGYRAGNKPRSSGLAEHSEQYGDVRLSVELQRLGRLGEWGAAAGLGLDPRVVLDWSDRPDPGYDFLWRGHRLDAKATPSRAAYLLCPRKKAELVKAADILLSVRVKDALGRATAEMIGWILYDDFVRKAKVAGEGHRLLPGTPYVDREDLEQFEDLRRIR